MSKQLQSYVSEIDGLLQLFDAEHPDKSAAQQAEMAKFERVAKLRDGAVSQSSEKPDTLWGSF